MEANIKKVYHLNYGEPFKLRDIDRLFYACDFINSKESFLMEKEKFYYAINQGRVKEYPAAVGM